ncbi:MAG TPA: ADOP family duplicated permease, partial [Thermoanaerobaculia bacterium]|nr:ADOP family duplicated permease [Thermoanaerobaculia bacterium]
VLGYGLWQRLYAGSDDAVGKELRVNGVPHTIVRVLPRDFLFVDAEPAFWLPLAFTAADRADDRRHSNSYQMVARLRDGASVEQARQQLLALNAANMERTPQLRQLLIDAGFTTNVAPLQERLVRDVRSPLYLLWAGVLVVMAIGCVNVANLALVRATARAREVAARQALGAGPWRLLRKLLVESLLLTATAGIAGAVIAALVLRWLAPTMAERIPRGYEVTLGAPTLGLVALASLLLGALLAALPFAQGGRASLAHTLREEGRAGTASRGARSVRRALVAAQVAFAFVLLLGAGLLLASFEELLRVRPGFAPAGVLSGKVSLPTATYPEEVDRAAFATRALERLRALPGVEGAAFASAAPFAGNYSDSVIIAEGYVPSPGESLISPAQVEVTPGYFSTLGIPVRRGRPIDERDTSTSKLVVVVDQRLADKFWPGKDPIGRRMFSPRNAEEITKPAPDARYLEVIGVVGDVKQRGLASAEERLGAYYFPYTQSAARTITLVARTSGDPLRLTNTIRRELTAVDPELPFYDVQTMAARVDDSVAGRRVAMRLATGFGLLALLLATVGIYGVLAYQVSQRRREIGIRMALGSASGRVFQLVLGEGAALLGIGLVVGFAGVFAIQKALAGALFGVTPFEPRVVAVVTALLALVALIACVVPARRAARIDPVVALTD